MRRWRSAFLFGGLAAALGLAPWLVGCTAAPLGDGEDPEEQVGEAESDLDFESPEGSSRGDGVLQAELSTGTVDEEPDPVPWKPGDLTTTTSGSPAPRSEAGGEPDPVPWTIRGRDTIDSHSDSGSRVH